MALPLIALGLGFLLAGIAVAYVGATWRRIVGSDVALEVSQGLLAILCLALGGFLMYGGITLALSA